MHKPTGLLGLSSTLLVFCLFAGSADANPLGDGFELKAGDSKKVVIGLSQVLFDEEFPTFTIDVPSHVLAVRVWTTDATGDVTLTGNYDTDTGVAYDYGYGEYGYVEGSDVWLDEEILMTMADPMPLIAGKWTFTVGTNAVPDEATKFRPLSCLVHYEIIAPARHILRPGKTLEIDLKREEGLRVVLRMPEDLVVDRNSRWRVEAYSANHDIDLVVGAKNPVTALDFPYSTSIREIGFERAEFKGRQFKNLSIQVYALPQLEVLNNLPVKIRLLDITNLKDESAAPPSFIPKVTAPKPAPVGASAVERASKSSVAIYSLFGSGSGTILSKSGYVVTNAHVVSGSHVQKTSAPLLAKGGKEWVLSHKGRNSWLPKVHGGFNLDPRLPAAPSVGMEIVDYRQDLDLALLRIVSTLDGQPLPADLDLQPITMGCSGDLGLGSILTAIGYPMTGGSSALVSITATRGICSGFTLESEGPAIKTDAGTHSGVSGGTLIDEAGRMVGIPSASITDTNYAGGIGFAIPVESIPKEWLALAGVTLPGSHEVPEVADVPELAVVEATYSVACGCALPEVGRCGNFIEVKGTYVELANSKELGLGVMEWCKKESVTVQAIGTMKGEHFHATSLKEAK